jgi:hypothetical protein
MSADNNHIMIGTPAYGGMVHTDFVLALLGYQQAGIRYSLITIGNESLITRARNNLISLFHHSKEFSHLLFLDADVSLTAEGLLNLMKHDKDVIGAPVPLKARDINGARIFNIGRVLGEEGPLLINERIGTAALLLSRHAVDALVEEAKSEGRVYEKMNTMQGDPGTSVHFDIFRVGVVDAEYLSEDFWVCLTLRRLGFPIYIDPTIVTRHHGTIPI